MRAAIVPVILAAMLLAVGQAAASQLRLDGIPDEALWQRAQVFDDFRVSVPFTHDAPAYPTRALLRALPEGLAVAFICDQPAGATRVKPRSARDASVTADRVNVAIDFDADGRIGYNFMVTLGGGIADEVISNQNRYNADWDGQWDYALHEGEDQWSVEFLIPWSIASMRSADGPTRRIGVYFDRVSAAHNERSATPPTSYEQPRFLSEFTHIEIERFRSAGALWIFPYVSGQYDLVDDARAGRAGVDVFWKPSPNFQLSAALNPDFGQVEADALVINFDAVETFFSDKRPFFTENQGIFRMPTADSGQLVYTRRIGSTRDDGEGAADIDVAVKLNGSVAGFDYGSLAAVESEHADDIGRAFFVQRAVRPVGPLMLGYLGTWADRPYLERTAQVHAVDVLWRTHPHWTVGGQVIGSFVEQGGDHRDGRGAWVSMFYTPTARFQHELELTHFDAQLDFNDVGFQRRASLNELEYTATLRQTRFGDDARWRSVVWKAEPQLRYNDSGDRLPPTLLLSRQGETRAGGIWYSDVITAAGGIDDLLSRGNGNVRIDPRISLWNYYESPRIGGWKYLLGGWLLQEGNDGYAFQPEGIVSWFPREDLNFRFLLYPRWSQDWLIWREDDLLASYRRRQITADFDVNWFPGSRHEFRLKAQWRAIAARAPTAYRIGGDARLRESADAVAPFNINSLGLQLRYRYEFGPQRELYVVYGRGGFVEEFHGDGIDARGIDDLWRDLQHLRDSDQLLVKLRWRL